MSKEVAPIEQEYIVREDIEARLDTRDVFDANGERYGYVHPWVRQAAQS